MEEIIHQERKVNIHTSDQNWQLRMADYYSQSVAREGEEMQLASDRRVDDLQGILVLENWLIYFMVLAGVTTVYFLRGQTQMRITA